MNKLTYIIILILALTKMVGQNFVPNPSFETSSACPTGINSCSPDEIAKATGWKSYRNSPDYFNTCASISSSVSVPQNFAGYKIPAAGNAYCGFQVYFTTNYREYIGAQLTTTLSIGTKYFVSFKIINAGLMGVTQGFNCCTDKIGVRFSKVGFSCSTPAPITNTAQVYATSIVQDSTNWTTISGSFVADSSYKYILVGNFFNDANTNTYIYSGSFCRAYYLIDDFCVSNDSNACVTITNINKNTFYDSSFKLYPNPSKQKVTLEFNNIKREKYILTIYDSQGLSEKVINNITTNKIEIDNLTTGLYFFKLQADNATIKTGKFIIE